MSWRIAVWVAVAVAAPSVAQTDTGTNRSPIGLAADPAGRYLYVADYTASELVQVDAAENKVVRRLTLPARPTGVAVTKSGDRVLVTVERPANNVFVVNAQAWTLDGNLAGRTQPDRSRGER
jgi:YVTN family beta-propeller protein